MNIQATSKLQPFDAALNDAIVAMANHFTPNFSTGADAPSTYAELKAHLDAGKPLIVAEEGSENTIFGCASVNYAFRAWHDWCHWRGGFDFSLPGESAACSLQIEHLRRFYGVTSQTDKWAEILIAEVVGQRRYYERYKTYIGDQRAFAKAYLFDHDAALSQRW